MSRYAGIPTAALEVTARDGARRAVRYYRRRWPPQAAGAAPVARHTVVPGDRLDLLSFRLTGDPLGFWRLCDANPSLDPDALVDAESVGTQILVPMPGAG